MPQGWLQYPLGIRLELRVRDVTLGRETCYMLGERVHVDKPEDVLDAGSLSEQGVDDGGVGRDHGGLQQVAEDGEDRVEPLKPTLLCGGGEKVKKFKMYSRSCHP